MDKGAMVWFDLEVRGSEARGVDISKFIRKDGSVDWEAWIRDISERGRKLARESAEWQEEALKKARIRV